MSIRPQGSFWVMMPWGLVLIGVFVSIVLEFSGISALMPENSKTMLTKTPMSIRPQGIMTQKLPWGLMLIGEFQDDADEDADEHKAPGQLLGHDAFDDERHQDRLGRGELGAHLLAVVAVIELAVDARVFEVFDVAAVVDEVLAGRNRT